MKPKKIVDEKSDTSSPEHRGWLADLADVCNSELAQGVATALVILAILLGFGLGVGSCMYLERLGHSEVQKATSKE